MAIRLLSETFWLVSPVRIAQASIWMFGLERHKREVCVVLRPGQVGLSFGADLLTTSARSRASPPPTPPRIAVEVALPGGFELPKAAAAVAQGVLGRQ
jgi:hypothetical protein